MASGNTFKLCLSFQNERNFFLTVENGKDRLAFKTTADRLQKASVSCKLFLNHYSVQTLYIRNIYTPNKEEWFPTVRLPGKTGG